MNSLRQFTNLYSKSKTLRFELKPVGETLENIQRSGIIERDTVRAENYRKMKKTIDEFHKSFIDRALTGAKLTKLDEFDALYRASADEKRTETWKKAFDSCKQALRREIVACFKKQEDFSDLNKKELIRNRLKAWIDQNRSDLYYTQEFHDFTTYFTGYNENRMNMYSDEEKATAVSHRLIDENLPKFLDNIAVYNKVKASPVAERFAQICADMEPWLNVTSLDDVFSVSHYNFVLTQSQIEAYNVLLGGWRDGDQKRQGLNEYINLYNQTHPDAKLPRLKMLYKQILSDRESISWLPAEFENASELLEVVQAFSESLKSPAENAGRILRELPSCDKAKVYVRGDALGKISVGIFGAYHVISDALGEEERGDYYALDMLEHALLAYAETTDHEMIPNAEVIKQDCISQYFVQGIQVLSNALNAALSKAAELLNTAHTAGYRLSQTDKAKLKEYLDAAMEILHFLKPLYLPSDSDLEKDDVFYGAFAPVYEELQPMTKLYDMVRNFATKKPFSTEKVKLNFDCSTLLDGWDVNKETQNLGVLFLRDGNYFLGIMDKRHNRILEQVEASSEESCYQKVQYKLLPGPNKMLPKVFFSKSRIAEFAPSEEVLRIYKSGSFKKGPAFSQEDCHTLIDFYKSSIQKHPEWSQFGFSFSPTETYEDISGFFREISEQGYKLSYLPISASYIDELVRDGKLYLFRIYNKDFSPSSKGRPNLHTMYWRALFSEENLRDVVYKLNGQAEIFYRKRSISDDDLVTHPANQPIAKKNPALAGQNSTFSYDIVKDRRYAVDKFQFHVPITMNFKAAGTAHINEKVCAYLKNNPDVNIIGIDRGERHLLYISMIDQDGRVVRDETGKDIQYSLNTITGCYRDSAGKQIAFETPYHDLLDQKERERQSARQNWDTVETIKELKEGYMSQVVHHIARLMVKYNAVVIMEDLNSGFKRGRIKVEKQVYQNFEKALIEKLNYLIFKDTPADHPGGLYHALQLTENFESFKKLTKQSGFLFYVPAWNTSKIDPVTGFVDLLKPKYTNVAAARAFFSKFQGISFDPENGWFRFRFDYRDFTEKAGESRTEWELCTFGELRYAFNRKLNGNRGGYEQWDVTERLKALFDRYRIDWGRGDLREAITRQTEAPFFASLIRILQVLLAMRYSCAEDGKDFILSPVVSPDGTFFCSEAGMPGLPQDADANGAYNIARKGLWVLRQINRAEDIMDWTTKVQNTQWLSFVQELTP